MSTTPRQSDYHQHQDGGSGSGGRGGGDDGLESRLIGNDNNHHNNRDDSSLGNRSSLGKRGSHLSNRSALDDPDSLLHTVFNIACHVVYPVITAPFFIGIFYIFAALRLAVPSMGWCSNKFTFNPGKNSHWSSSTLFILTGGLFRACPSATRNGDYAVIVFIVGLSLLFSAVAPMYDIVVSHPGMPNDDSSDHDNSIVIATIVGYIIAVYVFLWIGLKFSIYSRAEKTRERMMKRDARGTGHPGQQKSATLNAQREALTFLAEIPGLSVSFTPLWTVAVGIITSVVECVLFKVYSGHFTGAAAKFQNLKNEWSALTFATFFFLLASTNIISWFGLYLLYEQKHHLAVFTEKRKLSTAGGTSDAQVAKWAVAWQYLLQEMERAPMVCSISPACSVLLFIEAAISLMFGVIYNLYDNESSKEFLALQDLLPIFIFVGTHSILLLCGYLWVIVNTQNVIELQHKAISALQNSMQLQVDAAALEGDDQLLPSLRAKVRVLQSLDRFLLIADPKAKILGTSVDSFRWAIINFSLVVINVTFLLLYLVFCYKNQTEAKPKATTTMPNSTQVNETSSSISTMMAMMGTELSPPPPATTSTATQN